MYYDLLVTENLDSNSCIIYIPLDWKWNPYILKATVLVSFSIIQFAINQKADWRRRVADSVLQRRIINRVALSQLLKCHPLKKKKRGKSEIMEFLIIWPLSLIEGHNKQCFPIPTPMFCFVRLSKSFLVIVKTLLNSLFPFFPF